MDDRTAGGTDGTGNGGVLFYHSVGTPHGDSYGRTISHHRLRQDVESFLVEGYRIVDVPTIADSGGGGEIALTFDDGFESFYTDVLPVLEALDVPATVYVHTDAVGTDGHVNRAQLDELFDHDLVTVGNHTRTHPYLDRIDDRERLETEIRGAREWFEREFGVAPDQFAYPFYRFDEASRAIVAASHETAVAGPPDHPLIGPGEHLSADSDPHLLPRIDGITLSVRYNGGGTDRLLDGGESGPG